MAYKKHIISWFIYSVVLYLIYKYAVKVDDSVEHAFTFVILQVLMFYINLIGLLPKLFDKKKFVLFGFLNIILIIVIAFVNTILEDGYQIESNNQYDFFEDLLAHSVPSFIGIFIAILLHNYRMQLVREEQEKERIKAEKNFLIQQINPHFLFNTLNNIYSLTLNNNPKGSEAIMQLSKMLDYSLYGNNQEYVTLKKEIQYIDNFIQLFKLKDDELTHITFDFTQTNLQVLIAPMLLLPFVENAFKHGDVESEKGCVNVSICSNKHVLKFSCKNSYSKIKKVDRVGGIGIANVKRRLELLYPNQHQLTINDNNNNFEVLLKISIHGN